MYFIIISPIKNPQYIYKKYKKPIIITLIVILTIILISIMIVGATFMIQNLKHKKFILFSESTQANILLEQSLNEITHNVTKKNT